MANNLTQTAEWQQLLQERERLQQVHLRELFQKENRFTSLSFEFQNLLLDFSKQRLDEQTIQALIQLAQKANVEQWRSQLFAGEKINVSENRAVLHTALRYFGEQAYPTMDYDVMPEVKQAREQMRLISEKIRQGKWLGATGKPIENVVNIGIGGSDLGPKLVARALTRSPTPCVKVSFISNIDGSHIEPLLQRLNPETTLFIVVSKSFTTQETSINAQTAKTWLRNRLPSIESHFIAVTAQADKAQKFGIASSHILHMWDWVGGRYSLWSAVGLSTAIAIGMDRFEQLLKGAHAMDVHFQNAPLEKNLPVLLALISIWNTNFLGAETSAVLPYNEAMRHLPAYLQQLEMESNGKTVTREGEPLSCKANPIVWGEIGVNGQHAFFQLLHQGGWLIPCDFVLAAHADHDLDSHKTPLLANCLAQSAALAFGKTEAEARKELGEAGLNVAQIEKLLPHKVFKGNQPSTTILIPSLNAYHLGMLLALYEHKVFVQGVIWGINSFDQWGVELGKQLANQLIPLLNQNSSPSLSSNVANQLACLDLSTRGLIHYIHHVKP